MSINRTVLARSILAGGVVVGALTMSTAAAAPADAVPATMAPVTTSVRAMISPSTSLPVLRIGARGSLVRSLQTELGVAADGDFGPVTWRAVVSLQHRYQLRSDGVVERSTWYALSHSVKALPRSIPAAAITGAQRRGFAVVADTHTNVLYLLRYDRASRRVVQALQTPTSFGGCNRDGCYTTPRGTFGVIRKGGADHRSGLYDGPNGKGAPMPWPVFFHGGVAVHYDPLGASHACIHVPSLTDAKLVHDTMPIGATVVVQ